MPPDDGDGDVVAISNDGSDSDQILGPSSIVSRVDTTDSLLQPAFGFEFNSYNGPIPPPSILEGYDRLVPGSAKAIIENAHEQTHHRQTLESAVILGGVRRSDRGLLLGAALSITSIILGFIAIIRGHDVAGGTLATGSVVALASVFVYGTNSQRREREEKERIAESLRSGPHTTPPSIPEESKAP